MGRQAVSDDRRDPKTGPPPTTDGPLRAATDALQLLAEAVRRHCHELRQPLLGIKGYAELLVDGSGDPGLMREGCREMVVQADRIARLTDELALLVADLAGSAPPATHRRENGSDVRQALDAALRLFGYRLTPSIVVDTDTPTDLPPVRIPVDHLERIAINIIANALDAVNGQGRLQIRARRPDENHVVIEFADDGPGVATSLRGRLFEAYSTTKPPGAGTGLGLTICRELTVRAGGTLELVEDAVPFAQPAHTVFRLTLPAVIKSP
jgi:signal transduction histidine kinase